MDVDPRACIGSFFDRIQIADVEYKKHFDLEVEQFKARITKRAAEKIEEALAEQEVMNTLSFKKVALTNLNWSTKNSTEFQLNDYWPPTILI